MNRQPPLEIILVAYPTAQKAALYGLADLFSVADKLSRDRLGKAAPVLRLRSMDLAQIRVRSPDGTTENASLPDAPFVVIIPPSLPCPPAPDTRLIYTSHSPPT